LQRKAEKNLTIVFTFLSNASNSQQKEANSKHGFSTDKTLSIAQKLYEANGTPTIRATIIETLFSRNYIVREKKSLVHTEKGLSVYETVKYKRIADVSLTGNWENTLAQIERGETLSDTFRKAIEVYTRQITTELLDTKIEITDENACLYSKCKTAKVKFYSKVVKCADENCGFVVFHSKREKELTDKQITELLTKR
jgi:DNA topoisomerase-3